MSNTAKVSPLKIGDFLEPEHMACNIEAGSKKRVLETLSELIGKDNPYISSNEVFQSLIAREKLGSTGVGHGVAIPHGRMKGLSMPVAAFVKLSAGIDFDALDNQPVDLLFALLVPEQSTEEHLQLLASIARIMSDQDFCRELRKATSSTQLADLFSQK